MSTAAAPAVSLHRQDAVATLSIHGRTDLNLLNPAVFRALPALVDQCAADDTLRAIILRGRGARAFSAGVDLHEMKDLTPQTAEAFIRALHRAARSLLNAPLPVIAAVHGPCLGGALEIILACDLRIAAADAVFGLPEVRVGLPSVIEASLLPPTIGLGRARRLLLTGETVAAPEALQIGLIDQIVPAAADLMPAALDTARQFAPMSRHILAQQKAIVAQWLALDETAATEYSIQTFARCFATPYPRAAMTAFLEKRPPQF